MDRLLAIGTSLLVGCLAQAALAEQLDVAVTAYVGDELWDFQGFVEFHDVDREYGETFVIEFQCEPDDENTELFVMTFDSRSGDGRGETGIRAIGEAPDRWDRMGVRYVRYENLGERSFRSSFGATHGTEAYVPGDRISKVRIHAWGNTTEVFDVLISNYDVPVMNASWTRIKNHYR